MKAETVIKSIALLLIVACIVAITTSMLMNDKLRRRFLAANAAAAESNPTAYFGLGSPKENGGAYPFTTLNGGRSGSDPAGENPGPFTY